MNAHHAVRFLAPIVIAVVLGPLAVSIAIWLFNVGSDLFDSPSSLSLADERGLLFFLVVMTYFIGWPIAVLAGVLVSLWLVRRPPNVLVVNAAAVIATVVFMEIAATGVLGPVEQTNGRSNLLFTLVAAVFAANVCWFVIRRFLPPAPARELTQG
jgi:hypothetical protein